MYCLQFVDTSFFHYKKKKKTVDKNKSEYSKKQKKKIRCSKKCFKKKGSSLFQIRVQWGEAEEITLKKIFFFFPDRNLAGAFCCFFFCFSSFSLLLERIKKNGSCQCEGTANRGKRLENWNQQCIIVSQLVGIHLVYPFNRSVSSVS